MNVLITDGETCETYLDETGKLNIENGQVYDLGGGALNLETGNIIDKFSFVNTDVFFGMPESMQNAYFADKIPQYLQDIKERKRQTVNTWKMWKYFHEFY